MMALHSGRFGRRRSAALNQSSGRPRWPIPHNGIDGCDGACNSLLRSTTRPRNPLWVNNTVLAPWLRGVQRVVMLHVARRLRSRNGERDTPAPRTMSLSIRIVSLIASREAGITDIVLNQIATILLL